MNKCEYCEAEFSNQPALKKHKLTAMYCLTLRKESVENIKTYDCSYCEYSTTLKFHLDRHTKVCKHKKLSDDDIKVQFLLLIKDLESTQKQLEITEKRLDIESSKNH